MRLLRLLSRLVRGLLVGLLAACAPVSGQREALPDGPSETRLAFLGYWESLGDRGVRGLDRFSRTVQRVVETRARAEGGSQEEFVQAVLDDLVDLFVGERFSLEKSVLMSTPSVLGESAIEEGEEDLSGFAPRFQAGEGRFRHFALNAAAAFSAPDALVELAARLRGGDLQGSSPDSAADLATNRVGREFTRFLLDTPRERLAAGDSVREWLLERFGEP